MSLKPLNQLYALNLDYPTLNTSERGGILSYGVASGIVIVQYARDPSGVRPVGIQNNDVQHLDLSRQIHPRCLGQRVDQPLSLVGVITDGDVFTDWLSIIGTLMPGQPAYVGPSGTITNNGGLGNQRIGTFISVLQAEPHTVTFAGLGWSREQMDYATKQIFIENDPANKILVVTPGYAMIRISQSYFNGKAG